MQPKILKSKSNSPSKVISIGDLVTDLVIHIPHLPAEAAKHQLARRFTIEPGGAGNFLIAGARLGMDMLALGALGDDVFGHTTADILREAGVDMQYLVCQPGSTTTSVAVLVDDAGQHVFLGTYGEGDRVEMSPGWEQAIRASQAVFSCGYTLQEQRFSGVCLQSFQLAHQNNIPVFFDPGPEMARTTRDQRQAVLAFSQVILMTEEEIPYLADGQTGLAAARSLLDFGPELVCVKLGAQGCILYSHDHEVSHTGFEVPVRDTAAAGDSFAAAFIYAYLQRWGLEQVAVFANAMGAAKVQKMGSGTQVPTAQEVQAVLDQFHTEIHLFD